MGSCYGPLLRLGVNTRGPWFGLHRDDLAEAVGGRESRREGVNENSRINRGTRRIPGPQSMQNNGFLDCCWWLWAVVYILLSAR